MKKVEAPTLEAAYQEAAKLFDCSIAELQYEVVQYPSKGLLGFLRKNAIIVARCTRSEDEAKPQVSLVEEVVEEIVPSQEEEVASEIMSTLKEEAKKEEIVEPTLAPESIVDDFFATTKEETSAIEALEEEEIVYDELAELIETQLKELLALSCFDIDIVEVDVRNNTALIFIDGEDAALLIGKEGYRYNALSYMLFNWLHAKYELFIKLEIAEFLTSQQEMIRNYIQPVIENVEKHGKGKTRFLDGILVQIALEQLRERFPNKYVAVKTSRDGHKFVVINEFFTKHA